MRLGFDEGVILLTVAFAMLMRLFQMYIRPMTARISINQDFVNIKTAHEKYEEIEVWPTYKETGNGPREILLLLVTQENISWLGEPRPLISSVSSSSSIFVSSSTLVTFQSTSRNRSSR
jgi:hypothetical protein